MGAQPMATQRMLRFVTVGREMPEKREASDRARDFHEIYREFADAKAAEQSSRCSQCGVPYCQSHCPLHNNIPDWLRLTAEGRLHEAYLRSQETNTFPEICGRICPQDRLCEGNCVIEQSGHGTVTIGAIEKYITDTAWDEGWVQAPRPAIERPESVGIIGAGPGGLAAADRLRAMGFQVTVYDRHDRAGAPGDAWCRLEDRPDRLVREHPHALPRDRRELLDVLLELDREILRLVELSLRHVERFVPQHQGAERQDVGGAPADGHPPLVLRVPEDLPARRGR